MQNMIENRRAMLHAALASTALALLTISTPAFAGPAEELAKARIAAIANGDVAAITAGYASGPTLNWVGGPLDGTYTAVDNIKEVWIKFSAAQGAQKATIANISEAANPKGATVTANVVFAGKNAVKVRYVMVYRDGKLSDEIWQVNPNASY